MLDIAGMVRQVLVNPSTDGIRKTHEEEEEYV
jgi:hypothetical protein